MKDKIHRNVTLGRMGLDFLQFIRSQRVITRRLGPAFAVSRTFVEIDITYRCNMRCTNCNRSCTQAPSGIEMPPERIEDFIRESVGTGVSWRRIRLLGGEPTLHRDFFPILELLLDYRRRYHPGLRIVVCTNGHSRRVNAVLDRLPAGVAVKNTFKTDRQRLFRPFNLAPADSPWFRFSDYTSGCRILADCGIGFTPSGYYPCAVAGGIDRVFGFGLGRKALPAEGDRMLDLLAVFCPLCGHFGFSWPTRRAKFSDTWKRAYAAARKRSAPGPGMDPGEAESGR
ncbi:radical SAM protein [Desulfococcus sp.]|uniref:radical SAM protein n=1 Tax=Desulfococcus sp. TaxID=2025834 RepID=UPI003593C983